jgi:hypothetical protein
MATELSKSQEPLAAPPARMQEKHYLVRFHDKSHPNDTDQVILSVNGETLMIKRGSTVTLPERFVECARNATYPVYRQEPGHDRKVVGRVRTYPFDIQGEGRPEDYRRSKAEGTRQVYEALERAVGQQELTESTKGQAA